MRVGTAQKVAERYMGANLSDDQVESLLSNDFSFAASAAAFYARSLQDDRGISATSQEELDFKLFMSYAYEASTVDVLAEYNFDIDRLDAAFRPRATQSADPGQPPSASLIPGLNGPVDQRLTVGVIDDFTTRGGYYGLWSDQYSMYYGRQMPSGGVFQ